MSSEKMSERMRKVTFSDTAGNTMSFVSSEDTILADLEKLYEKQSGARAPHGFVLTDPSKGRLLNDKTRDIKEMFPGFADVEILALPDTVNAAAGIWPRGKSAALLAVGV
ncbi:MAG: hypothetical protein LBS21_05930 [Clostridiales bacterium]|jgi:hypothetical protein|nr:hypothetical protein [Clostridiales bacterium]